ncbi:MAG: 3-phosphoshikimate 1-carboxyvinyltransferase [Clostridiales bacterium]|nr:3-phosphoshikimate 1-carboxyvinyltransferase [Clostridiales bacterium]
MNYDIEITPGTLKGTVPSITSKSDLHRILICAALADRETKIYVNRGISDDITATTECLNALGADIRIGGDVIIVKPISDKRQDAHLNCRESGSTLRFLLPVASVAADCFTVTGEGRLPERPLDTLMDVMESHGCEFSSRKLPLSSKGVLTPGTYSLRGDVSSQYISGLLFALPLLDGDSEIVLTSQLQSKRYVDMTTSTLARFGVKIAITNYGYFIEGGQKYVSPTEIKAEGDWSNSAFWLCAGALGNQFSCTGLDMDSNQGDMKILQILFDMGADINCTGNSVTVKHKPLHSVEVSVSDIPDLVPVLAVVMSVAEGRSVIKDAGRLRLKESDRLHSVTSSLNAIGAKITECADGLEIVGVKKLAGGIADSFNDHRIAMALAVASTVCENKLTVTNAQAVKKSYPEFFEDFNKSGGKAHVISNR